MIVEGLPYGGDAPVHHVRGGYHVGPGARVGDGAPGEDRERGVVVHVAVPVEDPAMAVVGVLAEADVGDHKDAWNGILDSADRGLDDPLVGVCVFPQRVLLRRDAEKEDRRYSERPGLLRLLDEVLDA